MCSRGRPHMWLAVVQVADAGKITFSSEARVVCSIDAHAMPASCQRCRVTFGSQCKPLGELDSSKHPAVVLGSRSGSRACMAGRFGLSARGHEDIATGAAPLDSGPDACEQVTCVTVYTEQFLQTTHCLPQPHERSRACPPGLASQGALERQIGSVGFASGRQPLSGQVLADAPASSPPCSARHSIKSGRPTNDQQPREASIGVKVAPSRARGLRQVPL